MGQPLLISVDSRGLGETGFQQRVAKMLLMSCGADCLEDTIHVFGPNLDIILFEFLVRHQVSTSVMKTFFYSGE